MQTGIIGLELKAKMQELTPSNLKISFLEEAIPYVCTLKINIELYQVSNAPHLPPLPGDPLVRPP